MVVVIIVWNRLEEINILPQISAVSSELAYWGVMHKLQIMHLKLN